MAAGLGFKTFTTGEVLTAGDVNGYLMQGINVFANATARDAAITSPQEGQFAYTKDNNSLWYYTGSAWAASGATGDIEGVTAGVGISGGGTSGTVTITNDMATTITTNGDLLYGTGSGTYTRRGIGSTGQVLTVSGGVPTWSTPSSSGSTLLAYATSSYGSNYSTTSTSFVDVNASLFVLTFTTPASGAVVLRATMPMEFASTGQGLYNWREGTTDLTGSDFVLASNGGSSPIRGTVSWSCYLSGISAGSHTYKLGMRTTNSGTTMFGYTISSRYTLECWSA